MRRYGQSPGFYYDTRTEMFRQRKITREESIRRVNILRADLEKKYSHRVISDSGADNPLMDPWARRTMLNASDRLAEIRKNAARKREANYLRERKAA